MTQQDDQVRGGRKEAPPESTSATPEQQYYRERVDEFLAKVTRWQAILNEDRFQLTENWQRERDRKVFDVIATAADHTLMPVLQGDMATYRNAAHYLDQGNLLDGLPERVMSLLGDTVAFRTDL